MSRDRCATCAFRPGTEASETPGTMLTAQLCVLSGERFECHETDRAGEPCIGWQRAVEARGAIPEWRRKAGAAMLALLRDADHCPERFDSDEQIATEVEVAFREAGLDV